MVKLAIPVIKKVILSHSVDPGREARVRENGKPRQSRHDQHEITSTNNRDQNDGSSWFQFEQDSIQVLFSRGICSDINSKSKIQFDEIDGKGVQRVLTDLTLIKVNGPKCSFASTNSVECTHCFKVDSGASGNLIPLCQNRKIFPNVTQTELERSLDHRVQLLAYNKKIIKQLGVCYLHVKNSQSHTEQYKFFIVNNKFNLIIGVNCALRLGLVCFKTPIFQNWSWEVPKPLSLVTWTSFVVAFVVALVALGNAV